MKLAHQYLRWVSQLLNRHGGPPVFEPGVLKWDNRVRGQIKEIQEEFQALRNRKRAIRPIQTISVEQESLTDDEKWLVFFLSGYGFYNPKAEEYCPKTVALMRSIPGVLTSFFSVLEPGKEIPPHTGKYKGILRYHLGVEVPEPEHCGLMVDQQVLQLQEGQSLLFDDTFVHAAWNRGAQDRSILIIDLLRPLPWWLALLNRLAVQLIRYSDYVQQARKKLNAND